MKVSGRIEADKMPLLLICVHGEVGWWYIVYGRILREHRRLVNAMTLKKAEEELRVEVVEKMMRIDD